MNWLRSLVLCSVAASVLSVPQQAWADCSAPSQCICAADVTPTYVLDVDVPDDADLTAPVELEVLEAYGGGADALLGPDGSVFVLERPSTLTDYGIQAGDRALLFLDADASGIQARRLDADGDLDCYSADALPAQEVAAMALSEDCRQEANADLGSCDDTAGVLGCSISGAGPSVSLCLLALLGFVRRRESTKNARTA